MVRTSPTSSTPALAQLKTSTNNRHSPGRIGRPADREAPAGGGDGETEEGERDEGEGEDREGSAGTEGATAITCDLAA